MLLRHRSRINPIILIIGVFVLIAALLYAALNRSHEVAPTPPMHINR